MEAVLIRQRSGCASFTINAFTINIGNGCRQQLIANTQEKVYLFCPQRNTERLDG